MDAATRRLAWKCIEKATRNGQSVILTSHNMNECDSLCSTLAIMVDGKIKCIGSPQHLKHKFGDGYNVTIHKGHKLLTNISHDFVNRFPGSVVKRNHQSSITLQVPTASCSLADVLTFLQAEQRVKNIGFYSLTQTTLDSVFVNFAQDQLEQSQVSGTMKVPKRSRKLSSDLTPFNELNNDMSTSVTNDDLENLNGFRNPAFQRDNHVVLSPAVSYSGSRYVSIIPIGTQSNGNDPMESSHKGLSSYL
uniref:ABCA1-4-like C-terminal R2 regulatory domain-containing protein n=1 Tax=Biomphalaria glabrata TaxID=6526 RepID=A0A2C9LXB5_BIOGL